MAKGSFIYVVRFASFIASEFMQFYFPEGIYLFKVNNGRTRKMCEICSKLIIKIPERHWVYPGNTPSINWTTIHVTSPTPRNVQSVFKIHIFYASFMCVLFINFLCILCQYLFKQKHILITKQRVNCIAALGRNQQNNHKKYFHCADNQGNKLADELRFWSGV